jgi:hypothetical protein
MSWEFIVLLLWTAIWSALMGVIPPAVLGWVMFKYGQKLGDNKYRMAKEEIRGYIKGELITDLTVAVRDQLNGVLGPIAKGGSVEAQQAAADYARQNPGIAQLLLGVAARGGARAIGKKLGVPKDVIDQLTSQGFRAPSTPRGDPLASIRVPE